MSPALCGSLQANYLGLLFGSQELPESRGPLSQGSSLDKWPLCFLVKSGGAVPGAGYLTPVVWLLGESGRIQVVGS
jgi:hypothetical protein